MIEDVSLTVLPVFKAENKHRKLFIRLLCYPTIEMMVCSTVCDIGRLEEPFMGVIPKGIWHSSKDTRPSTRSGSDDCMFISEQVGSMKEDLEAKHLISQFLIAWGMQKSAVMCLSKFIEKCDGRSALKIYEDWEHLCMASIQSNEDSYPAVDSRVAILTSRKAPTQYNFTESV